MMDDQLSKVGPIVEQRRGSLERVQQVMQFKLMEQQKALQQQQQQQGTPVIAAGGGDS